MKGSGCLIPGQSSQAVAISGELYNPKPSVHFSGFIVYHDLHRSKVLWTRSIAAQVTAMQAILKHKVIVYALTNGEVGLLDYTNGRILDKQEAHAEAADNVILSLRAHDNFIAAGCIDTEVS